MKSMEALRLAEIEAARARRDALTAWHPRTRRSAAIAAQAFEDEYPAARLDAWAQFLTTTH